MCLIKLQLLSRNRQIHRPNFRALRRRSLEMYCMSFHRNRYKRSNCIMNARFFPTRGYLTSFLKSTKPDPIIFSLIYVPENPRALKMHRWCNRKTLPGRPPRNVRIVDASCPMSDVIIELEGKRFPRSP